MLKLCKATVYYLSSHSTCVSQLPAILVLTGFSQFLIYSWILPSLGNSPGFLIISTNHEGIKLPIHHSWIGSGCL